LSRKDQDIGSWRVLIRNRSPPARAFALARSPESCFSSSVPYRATQKTEATRLADRERVVRAAQALVAKGGFRSVAISDVARRARMAVGSVYRHFPSKAELFAEVFRRASGHEVQVTAQAGATRARAVDQVAHAMATFARRALESPTLAYALLAEPVDPAIEAERLVFRRAYRDAFARFIEEGVAKAELPPQDPRVTASALVGAIGEAMLAPLGERPSLKRRPAEAALLEELQRFIRRAIGATTP
jgi:AcrR family transcriptional regulator